MHRYSRPDGFTDPHDGRYLELMLSGIKKIAMFECIPAAFEPWIAQGVLHVFVKDRFSHVVYRPESEADMHLFCEYVEQARLHGFEPELERKIATLLGYSNEQIDAYLEASNKMFTQPHEPPKGIAPHEGQELMLMLNGTKRVALFEIIPDEFEPYLASGQFHSMVHERYSHIVYHPDFETQAEQLSAVLHQTQGRFTEAFEREIGRLLDYAPEDIEAYIQHIQPHFACNP